MLSQEWSAKKRIIDRFGLYDDIQKEYSLVQPQMPESFSYILVL